MSLLQYPVLPQVILAGGKPVFLPLRPAKSDATRTSSRDWKLDVSELKAAFNSKTKAIIVNTPNNPLGKVGRWLLFGS